MIVNKNRMTLGIILLVIGLCTAFVGIALIVNSKSSIVKVETQTLVPVQTNLKEQTTTATTPNEPQKVVAEQSKVEENQSQNVESNEKESIANDKKEKGDDFEKFVVQKFSKKFFTLLEWAGDKYVKGHYAETTTQPDLKLRFKKDHIEIDFSVECKYRSDYYKNGIEWCKDYQYQKYKKFAAENKIPVFIVIGVSGTAADPADLYVIPLEKIGSNFMTKDFLSSYQKKHKEKGFFFDENTRILK